MMRIGRAFGLLLALVLWAPTVPAQIQSASKTIPVDLELVLAVDVSRSVDEEEFDLQRQGYAAALTSPRVMQAIRSGALGKIAVVYMEWSGADQQQVMVPWTLLANEQDCKAFAAKILAARRPFSAYTSISGAITFSLDLLRTNPYEGTRQVIDISGDGPNNSGGSVEQARAVAVANGVTINGLPIVNNRTNPFGRIERDVEPHYRESVIGGPGAFLVVAEGFESFANAVMSKLIREVTWVEPVTKLAAVD